MIETINTAWLTNDFFSELDPCYSTVCFNGGQCVNGSCVCLEGYTGQYCETGIYLRLLTGVEWVHCLFLFPPVLGKL